MVDVKKNRLPKVLILYGLCSLWAIMPLSGCHQTAQNISSKAALEDSDVTLLWDEVPGATSYNVYMSSSPGVTKSSGHKIPNAKSPLRIRQLDPGKTYYFVVTVVSRAGESEESKELSYNAVADKVGLVYWKDPFDEPIHYHASNTAEIRQETETAPTKTMTEPDSVPPGNESPGGKVSGDEKASSTLVEENLQSFKQSGAETPGIEEGPNEASEPQTIAVETDTRMFADSHFHIFFDRNSNDLSPKATEKLDHIYTILTNNSEAKVKLNGYSDSSGAPSFNQMISEVRATSVKSYLVGKGIEPSRILTLGHGAEKSLASNTSAEGRRLNRRVEIELIMP